MRRVTVISYTSRSCGDVGVANAAVRAFGRTVWTAKGLMLISWSE